MTPFHTDNGECDRYRPQTSGQMRASRFRYPAQAKHGPIGPIGSSGLDALGSRSPLCALRLIELGGINEEDAPGVLPWLGCVRWQPERRSAFATRDDRAGSDTATGQAGAGPHHYANLRHCHGQPVSLQGARLPEGAVGGHCRSLRGRPRKVGRQPVALSWRERSKKEDGGGRVLPFSTLAWTCKSVADGSNHPVPYTSGAHGNSLAPSTGHITRSASRAFWKCGGSSTSVGQEAAGDMMIRSLVTQTAGVGLLLLTGCEASRNMRDDLVRLTSSQPTAQKSQSAKSVASTRPSTTPPASTTDAAAVAATATSEEPPARPAATATSDEPPALPAATSRPAPSIIGKSETELRALLARQRARRTVPLANFGAIETDNAPWLSSSIRTCTQNSSVLLGTR